MAVTRQQCRRLRRDQRVRHACRRHRSAGDSRTGGLRRHPARAPWAEGPARLRRGGAGRGAAGVAGGV